MSDELLSIRISSQMKDLLRKEADKMSAEIGLQISLSSYVRRILEKSIKYKIWEIENLSRRK